MSADPSPLPDRDDLAFSYLEQLPYTPYPFQEEAILSWFDPMQEGKLTAFLHTLTEPVILPVRLLCEKKHWFEGIPLDIPFLLTWILLSLIQVLIGLL